MASSDKYKSLLAGEHAAQQRLRRTVDALVAASVDAQDLLADLPARFDVDAAVGAQLDVLGAWVGLPRYIFVPTLGTVTLADVDYRVLLLARIAANHWDGSMDTLQVILANLFPGTGLVVSATDLQDMSMYIFVRGGTPTPTQLALLNGGLLIPKPSGVRVSGILVVTGPLFGLSQQDAAIAGPDFGFLF
jgi:hypothetical protein